MILGVLLLLCYDYPPENFELPKITKKEIRPKSSLRKYIGVKLNIKYSVIKCCFCFKFRMSEIKCVEV